MKYISVHVYISILAGILITCFTFVAVNKLLQPEIFRESLLNQPLPLILQVHLPWILPVLFLLNALLLTWQQVRSYGFILAFALFLAFTLYTSLILTHYFDYIPCTCGGISEALS